MRSKQDQRSQKLTPREPKGDKTRGFKVKTSTQKLKSQYVSSAKQSKKLVKHCPRNVLEKFQKDISSKNGDIPIFV